MSGQVLLLACHHRRYLFGSSDSTPTVASCVPCRTWRVEVVDYRDAVEGVDVHGPLCRTDDGWECICGLEEAQDDAERELLLGHD